MNRVIVTAFEELDKIVDLIHDEWFDLDDVRFDEEAGVMEIPFRRIWHDRPGRVLKNRLIYRVEEVDVLRCLLRFANVIRYEIHGQGQVGPHSFNCLKHDEIHGLLILCVDPGCELTVEVDEIHAEYREIEYRGKSKITRGLFWHSDSAAVYDV